MNEPMSVRHKWGILQTDPEASAVLPNLFMTAHRQTPLAPVQLFVDTVAVRILIGIRVICIAMEANGTA